MLAFPHIFESLIMNVIHARTIQHQRVKMYSMKSMQSSGLCEEPRLEYEVECGVKGPFDTDVLNSVSC